MNITVNKGGKDYEFKFTSEDSGNTRENGNKKLMWQKWRCDELSTPEIPCEVFFGDYDNTNESLEIIKKSADEAINKLPQIKEIEDVVTTIAEPSVTQSPVDLNTEPKTTEDEHIPN